MAKRKVAENDKTRSGPALRVISHLGTVFVLLLNLALLEHVIFGEI